MLTCFCGDVFSRIQQIKTRFTKKQRIQDTKSLTIVSHCIIVNDIRLEGRRGLLDVLDGNIFVTSLSVTFRKKRYVCNSFHREMLYSPQMVHLFWLMMPGLSPAEKNLATRLCAFTGISLLAVTWESLSQASLAICMSLRNVLGDIRTVHGICCCLTAYNY